MGKSTICMAIFNSYVSLPEGISWRFQLCHLQKWPGPHPVLSQLATCWDRPSGDPWWTGAKFQLCLLGNFMGFNGDWDFMGLRSWDFFWSDFMGFRWIWGELWYYHPPLNTYNVRLPSYVSWFRFAPVTSSLFKRTIFTIVKLEL